MQWKSLGKITTDVGTPVRLTANETTPTAAYQVYAILAIAVRSNTKPVHILSSSTARNATTEANTLATIAVPTLTSGQPTVLPSASASRPSIAWQGDFNVASYYLDVEANGEGVIISVLAP